MYHSDNACCQYITWAKPRLLLFSDYPFVESLDPATRKVRTLAQLDHLIVSPDGRWFAGTSVGGLQDPTAGLVYVLSTDDRKCLAVPHASTDVAGFTRDSRALVLFDGSQLKISSLRTGCPTSRYNGVLLKRG